MLIRQFCFRQLQSGTGRCPVKTISTRPKCSSYAQPAWLCRVHATVARRFCLWQIRTKCKQSSRNFWMTLIADCSQLSANPDLGCMGSRSGLRKSFCGLLGGDFQVFSTGRRRTVQQFIRPLWLSLVWANACLPSRTSGMLAHTEVADTRGTPNCASAGRASLTALGSSGVLGVIPCSRPTPISPVNRVTDLCLERPTHHQQNVHPPSYSLHDDALATAKYTIATKTLQHHAPLSYRGTRLGPMRTVVGTSRFGAIKCHRDCPRTGLQGMATSGSPFNGWIRPSFQRAYLQLL